MPVANSYPHYGWQSPAYSPGPYTPLGYPPANYTPPNRGNRIITVHGVEGAKACRLGQNEAALLLDDTDPYVYLLTTDGVGYPTLERYRVTPEPIEDASQTEVAKLKEEIESLKKTIERMNDAQPDIQQPAIQHGAQEQRQSDAVSPQGGYDWGYQAPVRPDAGQPKP